MKINFLKSLSGTARVSVMAIVVIGLLVSGCTAGGSAPQGNLQRDEDNVNSFQEAVNLANSADTLSKSAKTKQEWSAATVQWHKALTLLQSVPEADPNYAIAQQKLKEYQRNLDSAQQKSKAAK